MRTGAPGYRSPEPAGIRPGAPFRLKLLIGLVAVLSALTGSLARVMSSAGPPASEAAGPGPVDIEALRQPMIEVLRAHYYRDVDEAALLATPVEGWPTLLDDPYTHVLRPETVRALSDADSAHYTGIGIHAHAEAARIVIDSVFDASPALEAGLQPGDELVAVEGQPVSGLDLDGALNRVRGPEGSTVAVTTRRGATVATATLVRRAQQARLVWPRLATVGGWRLGVITIVEFDQGVGAAVREAVAQLRGQGARAVVLDLRHNPGGLVAEAVAVASVFLPEGSPVLIERGRHLDTVTLRTRNRPVEPAVPLAAVLVDDQSASAAEVVAGALRDGLQTRLVGHRTFGKGVIQDIYPLPGGAAVKATFAEYLTPAGTPIDRTGLAPDIAAPGTGAAPSPAGADPDLDADLRLLPAPPG